MSISAKNGILLSTISAIKGESIASGGGGLIDITEDFTGADGSNLSANWTEAAGDWNIFSNGARQVSGSYASCFAVYTGTSTSTIKQYGRITFPNSSGEYAGLIFRYVDSSSPFYAIYVDQNALWSWEVYPTAAGSGTEIQNGDAGTFTAGDTWGVTIEGTGSSTRVRIWKNPVAAKPISVSEWDSGDTTPELDFQNDPGTAADTGKQIGICGFSNSANNIRLDTFRAGDAP
jgi:hypothetical protein